MRYILPVLFLYAPQSQLILSANQNVWQEGIEHSPRVLISLKVYFCMGRRQETFELVKFQKCLGSHKGTECHRHLKSGRRVRWGRCLKWESEKLGGHHTSCWWRSFGIVSWPPLQTLVFVRSYILSKSGVLSWVGKHRDFMCDISFKEAWRDANLLFLEGFQLPLHR